MKKTLILTVFLAVALVSFAQEEGIPETFEFPNRNLFITGSAEVSTHRSYFMENFQMEATALGFTVVNTKDEAGYTFNFDSQRYEGAFIALITLTLNEGDVEIVNFGWPYSNLDEMYEYNQFVFFKAVVLIPGIDEDELRALMEQERIDTRWQYKRVYFRVSFDYPISFYALQPTGLYNGTSAYKGNPDDQENTGFEFYPTPLTHHVIALPAVTAGIEFQPLKFLAIEANVHAKLGEPNNNAVLNIMAGAQLKVPIRFKQIMVEPYAAFLYPLLSMQLNSSQVNASKGFKEFPDFFAGGGIQFCIKGGKSGSFFADANYMFVPPFAQKKEAILNNHLGNLYPNPAEFHYKPFIIGISIGYKFGVWGRR
jgi:hypothetical protein